MIQRLTSSTLFWLIAAVSLIAFANFWEPGIGVSTATYGAIARNLLETTQWFRPHLAPQLYDPFVEHPYLGLWLHAIFFKFFGASAQTVRLSSSFLGIACFVALFAAMRRLFSESVAILAVLCLLSINVFMNFMSSGWLDMPMVGLTMIAFYFATRITSNNKLMPFTTGLFLGLAFLTKGFGALGILPVSLLALFMSRFRLKSLVTFAVGFLAPVLAFTLTHYAYEGFFFWKEYAQRQLVAQNDLSEHYQSLASIFWYPIGALENGHLVSLLALPGVYLLWRKKHKALAVTIIAALAIHGLAYGFSSRHYRQYIVPLFPWLSISAAYFISVKAKFKIVPLIWSRYIFAFALIYFIATSIFPVTVHSMSGDELKAFQKELLHHEAIKDIYFESDLANQFSWETTGSYISWYFQKIPLILAKEKISQKLTELNDDEAILLERSSEAFKKLELQEINVCFWNNRWIVLSTAKNCDGHRLKWRGQNTQRDVNP